MNDFIVRRALVDVGLIYMTGDTGQLTKDVAKEVVRSALRRTVEDMIKNPDNFLRAMALKLCQDTLQELKTLESAAPCRGRAGGYAASRHYCLPGGAEDMDNQCARRF